MTGVIIFAAKDFFLVAIALAVVYAIYSEQRKVFLLYLLSVLALAYILGLVAGQLYETTRPFVELNMTPLIAHEIENGFPSNHALVTAAIAAAVTPFNLAFGIVLWFVAFVVGTARVIALVHNPVDIVGSFLIAIASAVTVWQILSRLFPKVERRNLNLGE